MTSLATPSPLQLVNATNRIDTLAAEFPADTNYLYTTCKILNMP